jgi:hypothetical protein
MVADSSKNSTSVYAEPFEYRSLVKSQTTGHVQVIADYDSTSLRRKY